MVRRSPATADIFYTFQDWELIKIANKLRDLTTVLNTWREMGLKMPENSVIFEKIEQRKLEFKRQFLAWSQILTVIRDANNG